jgi:hypothetical protein
MAKRCVSVCVCVFVCLCVCLHACWSGTGVKAWSVEAWSVERGACRSVESVRVSERESVEGVRA